MHSTQSKEKTEDSSGVEGVESSRRHFDEQSASVMNAGGRFKELDGVYNNRGNNSNGDVDIKTQKDLRTDLLDVCFILVVTRALPLAIYTVLVTAQRYHLFVWTVFSPKLLYEGMHTLIMSVVALLLLTVRLLLCR